VSGAPVEMRSLAKRSSGTTPTVGNTQVLFDIYYVYAMNIRHF